MPGDKANVCGEKIHQTHRTRKLQNFHYFLFKTVMLPEGIPNRQPSIDESIVPLQGRSPFRQYYSSKYMYSELRNMTCRIINLKVIYDGWFIVLHIYMFNYHLYRLYLIITRFIFTGTTTFHIYMFNYHLYRLYLIITRFHIYRYMYNYHLYKLYLIFAILCLFQLYTGAFDFIECFTTTFLYTLVHKGPQLDQMDRDLM